MRLQTKHLWNDFWRSLYSDQHTWQNQSEFSDWIQDQGEVDSGSNETWITKEQQDELWGLALKTNDIEATHARLSEHGVEISDIRDGRKPGTRVCTAKSHTLGVPTLLIEHPPR